MKLDKLKQLFQNKNFLYYSSTTVVVLAFLLWLAIHFSVSGSRKNSPLEAIPQNAAMIMELKQPEDMWSELSVNSGVWRELTKFETFSKINSDIIFLDSLFKKNDCTKDLISDNTIFLSFHFLKDNTCGVLYFTSLSGNCKKIKVEDFIKQAFKSKTIFIDKSFNGATITEVAFADYKKFYYTVSKDIFICSFNSSLIESAINQQKSGISVLNDNGFINVSETAGKKVNANIYINYKFFPQLFSSILSDDYKKKIANLTGFADWSAFDISVKNDLIMFNGFLNANDSTRNFISSFAGQESHNMAMLDVIPSSTASFVYYGFSDFDKWHKLYLQYLSKNGKISSYNTKISKFNSQYKTNIEKDICSWIGKEMALVVTEPSDSDVSSNMYAVIKANNITNAITLLSAQSQLQSQKAEKPKKEKNERKERKDKKGKKKKTKENEKVNEKKQIDIPVEINNNKIYEYNVSGALPALFGSLFDGVSGKYYAIIDDYVIFGNSINSLNLFLKDHADDKTLRDNNDYVSFSKNISVESNLYLYCNIKKSLGVLLNYVNKNIFKSLSSNLELFKNFDAFACQLKSSGKLFYGNICLRTNTSTTDESTALWASKLDTAIFISPQVVTDVSGRSKKIIAFDGSSNMYLIEKDGMIKWKIQLKEKPLSKVFVVDINKNGKSEYVFNTQSYIYCIDGDGKNVENFPLQLSDASTEPMTVVDIANNKDYRFIVPSKNKILNFLKNGSPNKGWTFTSAKNNICKEVAYIKFNGIDYFITTDIDGNLYVLDKKGNEKIKMKSAIKVAQNSNFYFVKSDKNNKAEILTTDYSGSLVFITSSGQPEIKTISKFSPFHYFLFEDINNNNQKEYVFIDNNKLSEFNSDLKQTCSFTAPAAISDIPIIYKEANNKSSIGFVCSKINKIYLVKPDGSLHEGFPMTGSTAFSITNLNNDGALNLIVGYDRTIYNYSLKNSQ